VLQWDITDLNALSGRVSSILAAFPQLDTVFINAGIQKLFSFLDAASSSPESVIAEINSNLTAPLLLARLFLPHLQSLASAGAPANLLITSSSLGYLPLSFYPVYCPTKAAIHSFCIVLRQQLAYAPEAIKKNLNVVEIVPPYTDTDLDKEHRAASVEMQGGPDKAFKPMPLDEYVQQAFEGLKFMNGDGAAKKEVAVGLGQMCVDTWRGGFGKILESMGIDC
jgi:short-subunit dehydrogenase involved in D-alanine esterification of teichoic acids